MKTFLESDSRYAAAYSPTGERATAYAAKPGVCPTGLAFPDDRWSSGAGMPRASIAGVGLRRPGQQHGCEDSS